MLTFADWVNFIGDLILIAFGVKLTGELLREGKVPPYIRTRTAIAEEVAEVFGTLPLGSVLYDPGCGDGRVLFAVARRNPGLHCVGIELRTFPYGCALWKKRRHPGMNVNFVRANAFAQDLSPATHLYTYLYPNVMDALLPKLEKELRPGTILLSLDFPFTHKQPVGTVPLVNAEEGKLGSMLYTYVF